MTYTRAKLWHFGRTFDTLCMADDLAGEIPIVIGAVAEEVLPDMIVGAAYVEMDFLTPTIEGAGLFIACAAIGADVGYCDDDGLADGEELADGLSTSATQLASDFSAHEFQAAKSAYLCQLYSCFGVNSQH